MPQVPTMVTDVTIPPGTKLNVSAENSISPKAKEGVFTGDNIGGGGAAMKQILKSIFLFEAVNFLEFVPEIPHNFHVLVSLTIGSEDEAGGSDYSVGVCTPTWLDHHIQNTGPLSGRHLLIVNRFDAAEIRAHIEKIISQCEREDPVEANAVLGRFFAWEFEDYQP